MLQLLQPVWLFTLAGISIPVIIHLWNQKPGKTLKVGSISLVKENASEYKRSFRLSELLLLLLRCLLIAVISFALAKPVWNYLPDATKQKGWLLITNQNTNEAYTHFKPAIDSLLQAGFELHAFEEGFQKLNIDDVLKKRDDTVLRKSISYRRLIESLDEQIPAKLPVYIITDNYLKNFTGERSIVSLNLKWLTYMPDNTDTTKDKKPQADTTAFRITIFPGKNDNDAHYLKAAIEAIQQFSKKNINLTIAASASAIPAQQDWLFWLSDQPAIIQAGTKNVLMYENGKIKKKASWIKENQFSSALSIPLYQSIIQNDSTITTQKIWEDGFGHPLLSVNQRETISYYHFYSRFDPAWNELPWSDAFPEMIYQLIEKKKTEISDLTDRRIIDQSQLLPLIEKEINTTYKSGLWQTINLDSVFWLIAFILFFVERIFSFYIYKTKVNG